MGAPSDIIVLSDDEDDDVLFAGSLLPSVPPDLAGPSKYKRGSTGRDTTNLSLLDALDDLAGASAIKRQKTSSKAAEREAETAAAKLERERVRAEAKLAKEIEKSRAAKEKDVNRVGLTSSTLIIASHQQK